MSPSASAQATLTLLGALKVRSNPATARAVFASTACPSLLILSTSKSLTAPLSPAVSALMPAPIHCGFGALLGARGTAKQFTREGVLNHAEHPEKMLFAHLGAGFDADSAVQNCERWPMNQPGGVPNSA